MTTTQGPTITLKVEGMSCGHCVKAVTAAIQAKDPDAKTAVTDRSAISVESIWRFAHELDPDDVRDVLDRQLELNRAIVQRANIKVE